MSELAAALEGSAQIPVVPTPIQTASSLSRDSFAVPDASFGFREAAASTCKWRGL